jgi:hypothetical protein
MKMMTQKCRCQPIRGSWVFTLSTWVDKCRHVDAFKKEATSTDAAVVAQRARVSPDEKHFVVPTE